MWREQSAILNERDLAWARAEESAERMERFAELPFIPRCLTCDRSITEAEQDAGHHHFCPEHDRWQMSEQPLSS
jgi:hypothetical protein